MKLTTALFAFVAISTANAQDTFTYAHNWSVGEKNAYKVTMKMAAEKLAFDMSANLTQNVQKVYENGDADVQSAITELTVSMNGNQMKPPPGPPTTSRVNKYGMPIGTKGGDKGLSFNFLGYANSFASKPMKVGDTVQIDYTDPDNPKSTVKGTAKFESLTNGIAKIVSSLDVTTPISTKPMHIDSISLVDTAASKANHVEGKVTGIATTGGPKISSITFTMDRM